MKGKNTQIKAKLSTKGKMTWFKIIFFRDTESRLRFPLWHDIGTMLPKLKDSAWTSTVPKLMVHLCPWQCSINCHYTITE